MTRTEPATTVANKQDMLELAEELDDVSNRLRERADDGDLPQANHDEMSRLIDRLKELCPEPELNDAT